VDDSILCALLPALAARLLKGDEVMARMLESVGIVVAALLLGPIVLIYVSRLRARLNFDYAMRLMARRAVMLARAEHGVELDYTPASIERVEGILGKICENHLQKPMSDKELSILSVRWGAYIGEVMKRVRPAKWRRDSGQAGERTMPLVFDGGREAYPRSWVYKRIVDGSEDNVAFKFQALSDPQLRNILGMAGDKS
jgi:hypothetical protein